ncbi:MAG: type III secretion system chaperone, partial [Succinivibrio sp.]|nr:type III secretion system chaperone [Succinivibrio sp.]
NYLEQSDSIVIFSPVGSLGEIGNAGKKAEALLKLNDIGCDVTGQVTLMLDPEIDLVLAADRQSALSITSKDELSAWIEVLVKAVRSTREYFAEHFPLEE